MTSADDNRDRPREGVNRGRPVAFLLALPAYFAVFLFLPAGTWAWARGRLFIGAFLGTMTLAALYLWNVNPEVWVARARSYEGT